MTALLAYAKSYGYVVAAMFVLGLIIGAYVKGVADGNAACDRRVTAMQVAAQAQKDAEAEKSRRISETLERENAKARIVYRTITRDVERIVERPIYKTACFDDDGVAAVNRALDGPNGVSKVPND